MYNFTFVAQVRLESAYFSHWVVGWPTFLISKHNLTLSSVQSFGKMRGLDLPVYE